MNEVQTHKAYLKYIHMKRYKNTKNKKYAKIKGKEKRKNGKKQYVASSCISIISKGVRINHLTNLKYRFRITPVSQCRFQQWQLMFWWWHYSKKVHIVCGLWIPKLFYLYSKYKNNLKHPSLSRQAIPPYELSQGV